MNDEIKEEMESEDFLYQGRIKEVEEIFINYVIEGGSTKRTEIESHILAYLLLHPQLTQAQIQRISQEYYQKGSKKGISRGAISSYLDTFSKTFPILKKEKVLMDKNYTYVYSFEGSMIEILRESSGLGADILKQMVDFFNQKLVNLTHLQQEERAKSQIYPTLLLRVKELADFWEYYLELFSKILPGFKLKKKPAKIYHEIDETTPDLSVEDIEEELIEALVQTPGFMVKNEEYTRILSYLILRKSLTQSELRKLTGHSAGYISEALNHLIEEELVEKVKIPRIRKPYYQVESIPLSYLKRFQKRLKLFEKWKPELQEGIKEFEENKEELENLNGYERVKEMLKGYMQMIPFVERFFFFF